MTQVHRTPDQGWIPWGGRGKDPPRGGSRGVAGEDRRPERPVGETSPNTRFIDVALSGTDFVFLHGDFFAKVGTSTNGDR